MNATERRQRGTLLCTRLSEEVAALAPEHIGQWPPTWPIVAPADTAFMLALTRWEATGDEAHKPPLRSAYFDVLAAWRRAAAEYDRERASR